MLLITARSAGLIWEMWDNMRGFKGAIIIIDPWYELESGAADAPDYSFQHRRYAS